MSITLSVPPAVVQQVRAWAEANGTSLNQYIRDCLDAKCAEIGAAQRKLAADFLHFAMSNLAHAPAGGRFRRERDGQRTVGVGV